MRGLVVREELDIDPLSEASVRLILEQAGALSRFTVKEGDDVHAALELLAFIEGLIDQGDIESTVTLVKQAFLGDPALVTFIGAAATAPGQTSEGPGDVGNFFPYEVGNTWMFQGTETLEGEAPTPYANGVRVTDVDAFGLFAVEESNGLDIGEAVREFFEKTSAALVYHGGDDPEDPVAAVAPFDEVHFPLRTGAVIKQYDEEDVSIEDLDDDGRNERVDLEGRRKHIGYESVSVPAGDFDDCALLETKIEATVRLSRGGRARVKTTVHEWFAPGMGLVKSETELCVSVSGDTECDEYTEEVDAYQVGNEGRGVLSSITLAEDITRANSDTQRPGRPGVGFDGLNYLVVTCRDLDGSAEMVGVLVSGRGVVLEEFPILSFGINDCTVSTSSVIFDGANYLIVYGVGGDVRGVRVSPDTTVLDPAGFLISENANSSPSVSFDGTNTLVVWRRFFLQGDLAGDIYGAFVTPAGTTPGEFAVHSAFGPQGFASTTFGAGNHMVLWSDRTSGTNKVRGARVTPAGVVLDPSGFTLSEGTDDEGDFEPRADFDGTHFFVVWLRDNSRGIFAEVIGARVNPDGTLADASEIPISSALLPNADHNVIFDGTNYFVAWDVRTFDEDSGIHAARITPAGEFLDGLSSESSLHIERSPSSTRLVHPAFALGSNNFFIAWFAVIERFGEAKDIEGVLVYPF